MCTHNTRNGLLFLLSSTRCLFYTFRSSENVQRSVFYINDGLNAKPQIHKRIQNSITISDFSLSETGVERKESFISCYVLLWNHWISKSLAFSRSSYSASVFDNVFYNHLQLSAPGKYLFFSPLISAIRLIDFPCHYLAHATQSYQKIRFVPHICMTGLKTVRCQIYD